MWEKSSKEEQSQYIHGARLFSGIQCGRKDFIWSKRDCLHSKWAHLSKFWLQKD